MNNHPKKNTPNFSKKYFNLMILIGLIINVVFFSLTFQNPWISDGYSMIFGTKLFNLINNQNLFFFEFNAYGNDRFLPLFTFIVQFIPDNYIIWHGIVVFIFYLSSIFLYLVTLKLTNNSKISLLSVILYSLNYSLNIKMLSWNIFFSHIFNGFLGITSIFFFLLYLENKKKVTLILYFFSSIISTLIFETGLVYPLITLAIVYFCKNIKDISSFLKIIIPIFFYVFFVFLNSGKFLPIFFERADPERSNYYSSIFKKNDTDDLYFYRSNYAPRDFKGYYLRAFDNILGSLNISSFEHVIKYYDKQNLIKRLLKKNFLIFSFFSILIFLVLIYFTLKDTKIKIFDNFLKKISLIYFFVFFTYTIVFFRKDLNLGLSLITSILLSTIIYRLYLNKKKILASIFFSLFTLSSILYATTKFEYFSNEFSSRTDMINHYNSYLFKSENNILDKSVPDYDDYKFFFYYKNYEEYKSYLKKYKGVSMRDFRKKFLQEE